MPGVRCRSGTSAYDNTAGTVILLFDQNLSPKLARRLRDIYVGSIHVREIGLADASDTVIWEYAAHNGAVIVSKDADFHQRSFLYGYPPKVVWVRLGNCSTADVERVLRKSAEVIAEFINDIDASFLPL